MDPNPADGDARPSGDASPRPLTICAIGYADSPHVANRLRCFAERGHKVYLITERAAPEIEGVAQLVPGLDQTTNASFPFRAVGWLSRKWLGVSFDHVWRTLSFVRLLRRLRPDVVHVHYAYTYYSWIAGVAGCRPLVVSVMGGDVLFAEQGSPTVMGKWLTLNTLRRADYITSKSDHLTSALDRLGGLGKKAERIVWGIPVRRFERVDAAPLRERFGLEPGEPVLLSPRILQALYRVHLIVEAMPAVLAKRPDTVLLIMEYAADPEYHAEIVNRVGELGLEDRVRFIGQATHAEMPMFYSLADLTVAVPSSDGLPQSLLESMACGTPNVLSQLPQYEEIVRHGQSAYFVKATPEGIAQGILELLDDPGLRRRIAADALALVRREADLDKEAEKVERRYRDLAETVAPRAFDLRNLLSCWSRYRAARAGPQA
jgi:glycosyltransferase involved in cell wall biosynthesis